MNYANMYTLANSLLNRIDAALEHDQPETFAFTIGVQIGAFRSKVQREMRSMVSKSKLEQSLLESMDSRCHYIESEMIEAMALTREHSQMMEHLGNCRNTARALTLAMAPEQPKCHYCGKKPRIPGRLVCSEECANDWNNRAI